MHKRVRVHESLHPQEGEEGLITRETLAKP